MKMLQLTIMGRGAGRRMSTTLLVRAHLPARIERRGYSASGIIFPAIRRLSALLEL